MSKADARYVACAPNQDVPMLAKGQIVRDTYFIERMIGTGGFGQIYQAHMMIDKQELKVALKVSLDNEQAGRMYLEAKVLTLLRRVRCVPYMLSCGRHSMFNFIALELLGENLSELRRRHPNGRLSVGTVLRVGQQAVNALKAIHDLGWLHRDIKPSNFCIGQQGLERRQVFVVDFGMTRRYKNADGVIRTPRDYVPFRGTIRFASPNVHLHREHGPVDDLWSLLYTLTELAEGGLPWRLIREFEDVGYKKRHTKLEGIWLHLPSSMTGFKLHLLKLGYLDVPNYSHLNSVLQKGLPNDVSDVTLFDWEITPPIPVIPLAQKSE